MKKILICLLTCALILSLAGCSTKKLEEKIAEKIFEEAGGSDLNIDGDKVIIKGENGEEVTFGDNKWPTSKLAKVIPEFSDGTVSAVLESPDSVMITLESVRKEDASSYFETIKKDFPQDVYETNADDMLSFNGKNDADVMVALVYMSEVLTINIAGSQE